MIKCTKCLIEKDLINFPVEKNGRIRNQCKKCRNILVRKWQKNNKDKIKIATKRYYENNKNKVLFSAIERKYGITEVQYKEMMNNQKGVCFTCGETNGKKKLVVDHCHNTSKIRGLLCDSCNRSIGLLRENVNTLNNIINYLSIS